MKTRTLEFVNSRRFPLYCIQYKKNLFSRWKYFRKKNGKILLMSKKDSLKYSEWIENSVLNLD